MSAVSIAARPAAGPPEPPAAAERSRAARRLVPPARADGRRWCCSASSSSRGFAAPLLTSLQPEHAEPERRRCTARAAGTCSAPTSSAGTPSPGCCTAAGSTCGSRSSPCCSRSARHGAGQPGRLLRRLGRHRHHAPGRHRGRVPVLRAGHRAGVRARPGPAQHLHRDHARRLGLLRPDHPRRDPGRQAAGVRARGPVRRPVQPADHGPPPAAQRDHPGDHLRDVRHRAGHPGHRHARATWASASRRRHRTGAR